MINVISIIIINNIVIINITIFALCNIGEIILFLPACYCSSNKQLEQPLSRRRGLRRRSPRLPFARGSQLASPQAQSHTSIPSPSRPHPPHAMNIITIDPESRPFCYCSVQRDHRRGVAQRHVRAHVGLPSPPRWRGAPPLLLVPPSGTSGSPRRGSAPPSRPRRALH